MCYSLFEHAFFQDYTEKSWPDSIKPLIKEGDITRLKGVLERALIFLVKLQDKKDLGSSLGTLGGTLVYLRCLDSLVVEIL